MASRLEGALVEGIDDEHGAAAAAATGRGERSRAARTRNG